MNTFNKAFIKIFPDSVPAENTRANKLPARTLAAKELAILNDSLAQSIAYTPSGGRIASDISLPAIAKNTDPLAVDCNPNNFPKTETAQNTGARSGFVEATDREEFGTETLKMDECPTTSSKADTIKAMNHPAHIPLQAALEVDSFCWPTVCDHLMAEAGPEIRAITDELYCEIEQHRNVILITGHERGEGRTSTSICLATALSKNGTRVVLVDADIQRPHLAGMLGILPPSGWEETSRSGQRPGEHLIESINDQFAILPLNRDVSRNEWDSSLPLPIILEQLRDEFDVILIDTMPLEADGPSCSMLSACGPFVDTAILLQNKGHHNAESLLQSTNALISAGITPLGAIQNALPIARAA